MNKKSSVDKPPQRGKSAKHQRRILGPVPDLVKLLEVNPNPGWCWDGHLVKMTKIAGISYAKMLEMILQAAEQRLKPLEETVSAKN